ncbi:sensor histidine kinase [Umezawaea beigongshangensis]|uniref:sensor histidine kinase n=1 Tax=Umezawaea beigongshangensis TaxID=2780383 RepID=UPI0027DBB98F|nr:histidine kinase [Umezawaea beigongshangensis]
MAREVLTVGIAVATVLLVPSVAFPWSQPFALVACAALPLRLRWPWLAALLCLPAVAGGVGWTPSLVALYRVGRTARHVTATATWAATVSAAAAAPVLLLQDLPPNTAFLTVLFTTGAAAAPAVLGALVATREDLSECLAEVRRAKAAEIEAREQIARASERTRIGREIHDAVGHHATLIAVEAAALAATTREEHTRSAALRVRGLAKESLAEMRTALGLLNAPGDPAQGYEDLPSLVNRARAAGMPVKLVSTEDLSLSSAVGRAAFRVVQEALTNVTRHAPGAAVTVKVLRAGNTLEVSVVNGPAPEDPGADTGGGTGLHGLHERVRSLGGTLRAEPRPDGGFAVNAVLPVGSASKVGEGDSTFGGGPVDSVTA